MLNRRELSHDALHLRRRRAGASPRTISSQMGQVHLERARRARLHPLAFAAPLPAVCETVPPEQRRDSFTGMLSTCLALARHPERVPTLSALDVPRAAAVAKELLGELATWNSETEPLLVVASLARQFLATVGTEEPLEGWNGSERPEGVA